MMRWLALLCLSCAPVVPYVRTHALEPFTLDRSADGMIVNPWLVDGPPLMISVYNPTAAPARVGVQCRTEQGATRPWRVTLPARGEYHALGRVMNRDAHVSPCWVVP